MGKLCGIILFVIFKYNCAFLFYIYFALMFVNFQNLNHTLDWTWSHTVIKR